LQNNKKVINTKLSAVSSFFNWSLKRGLVKSHPFDKKLDRMKGAGDEHILNSYFLTSEQIARIQNDLCTGKYDIQDRIIFNLMYDSANRIGAIAELPLSSLDLDNMLFDKIREKRGYRVQVVFLRKTKDLIVEWLEKRKTMDNLQVDSLFIAKHADGYSPMSKSTIQKRIIKIGKIVGLTDFHAHCIRKSRLSAIYDATGDLVLAAELANHKSTETTRVSYLRPKSKIELRDKLMLLCK
jgi:integrase/recombinase XerC